MLNNNNNDDNIETDDDDERPAGNQHRTNNRIRNKTRQVKAILNHTAKILMSRRVHEKYKGLPPDTPPPPYESYLEGPQWHIWEWWSGSGRFTEACSKLKLWDGTRVLTGPPISWETGWDLRNSTHQAILMRLYRRRRSMVILVKSKDDQVKVK